VDELLMLAKRLYARRQAGILCEVKTINTSDEELQRRESYGVGASSNVVDEKLLTKLSRDIAEATNQMDAYNPDVRTPFLTKVTLHPAF
jgi:hypothetical protein